MSAIDEGIVREYFEQNGFFVRQARKYQVQARKKTGEEEIDLLVYNPIWQRGSRRPEFFAVCERTAVHPPRHRRRETLAHRRVFARHAQEFPRDFGFLEKNVIKQVARMFPTESLGETEDEGDIAKILVLPALPTAEPARSQSVQLLKERGVDAIISFRAMLLDLIATVETNRSYGKSDTLQVIRLLKNYDLLKEPQMDLLTLRERRSQSTK